MTASLRRQTELPLRAGLILGFAILVCLRLPDVILHGRLWAEEGRIFYSRAATMPWYAALVQPLAGYLNLVANAAPIFARQVAPLEHVPWVTTGIGLIIQCCPAVLLVCAHDSWLWPPVVRIAALLLLATAPLTEEVWLQTLHSQFHLTLCGALILALDVPGRSTARFGYALLLLAPLCGPSAIALLPLFIVRAGLDRSRARLVQASFLGVGAAIQMLLFYSHEPGRTYGIGPIALLCVVFIKQIVVPLAGQATAQQISTALQAQIASRIFPTIPVVTTLVMFCAVAAALYARRAVAATWLFIAAGLLAWVSYFGALHGGLRLLIIGEDGRYSFLPEVLTGLSLLSLAAAAAPAARPRLTDISVRWVARAVVAWLLLVGIGEMRTPLQGVAQGPDWRSEIALWRADHNHPIAIWPTGWFMTLKAA